MILQVDSNELDTFGDFLACRDPSQVKENEFIPEVASSETGITNSTAPADAEGVRADDDEEEDVKLGACRGIESVIPSEYKETVQQAKETVEQVNKEAFDVIDEMCKDGVQIKAVPSNVTGDTEAFELHTLADFFMCNDPNEELGLKKCRSYKSEAEAAQREAETVAEFLTCKDPTLVKTRSFGKTEKLDANVDSDVKAESEAEEVKVSAEEEVEADEKSTKENDIASEVGQINVTAVETATTAIATETSTITVTETGEHNPILQPKPLKKSRSSMTKTPIMTEDDETLIKTRSFTDPAAKSPIPASEEDEVVIKTRSLNKTQSTKSAAHEDEVVIKTRSLNKPQPITKTESGEDDLLLKARSLNKTRSTKSAINATGEDEVLSLARSFNKSRSFNKHDLHLAKKSMETNSFIDIENKVASVRSPESAEEEDILVKTADV